MKMPPKYPSEQTTPQSPPTPVTKKKGGRLPTAVSFPSDSVNRALDVANALWELNTNRPSKILDLAQKMGYRPASNTFQKLLGSAYKYGLVENSWARDVTKTTGVSMLGQSIVGPTATDNPDVSKVTAFLKPRVFGEFLHSIASGPMPSAEICKNMLMRDHHIPKESVDSCHAAIMKNLNELNLLTDVKGILYVQLDRPTTLTDQPEEGPQPTTEGPQPTTDEQEHDTPVHDGRPKKIFIAHGKNKTPLDQLENILRGFNVSYVVAVDEPNAGLPVSEKVAKAMRECGSGIFIFTADDKITKEDGTEAIWPNLNVVYELGAGSVLYENRIVILKEEGVSFPSDFSGVTRISFDKDNLASKAMDLLKELVAMNFLRVTPT